MNNKQSVIEKELSPAKLVDSFINRFDPEIGKLVRALRKALRKRLPGAIELVYDNLNALAIGFCTTERASDCMLSIAVFARGAAISFYYGASLPDPEGILQGTGKQNRYLPLTSAVKLSEPAVEAVIAAAVSHAKVPLLVTRRSYTVVKSVSGTQRPRRAAAQSGAARDKPSKVHKQVAIRKA